MEDIEDQIYAWVAARPLWEQSVFRAALQGTSLTGAELDRLVDLILGETSGVAPVERADLPRRVPQSAAASLRAIENVRNVNALAEGQRLPIAGCGVTLVYGPNGAGKTGYSRVFHHLGRTPDQERLLTRIGEDAAGPQVVTVCVAVGQEEQRIEVDLEDLAPGDLSGIRVFDSKAGNRYLSSRTAVDVVPLGLLSLNRHAEALRALASHVESLIDQVSIPELDSHRFAEGTSVRALAITMSAATADAEIEKATSCSDEDVVRLAKLRQEAAQIASRNSAKLRSAAEAEVDRVLALEEAMRVLETAVGSEAVDAAKAERAEASAAAEASAVAATTFAGEPVEGVGSQAWRSLWHAATEFAREHERDWMAEDGRCVLCMQPLSSEAHSRMHSFEAFVEGRVNERKRAAEQAISDRLGALPTEDARRVHREALQRIAEDDQNLKLTLDGWLDEAAGALEGIRHSKLIPDLRALPRSFTYR
ncbi:MAG: hypothetical protein M9964_03520 [Solirubrobacterales bacterium]|nr:hypothetical protein [Thermoleophilales bacterium]MCO5326112.1 hypothetical protein [Solirubrobacterales bacterium]